VDVGDLRDRERAAVAALRHARSVDPRHQDVSVRSPPCASAWCLYGLLVIPGLELTWEDRPERSAHALAVGVRDWIALD
jgi:hypothetical protein